MQRRGPNQSAPSPGAEGRATGFVLRSIDSAEFAPSPGQIEGQVHLWRIDLARVAEAVERWRPLLQNDELRRADRFHFEKDRMYYTSARVILRILLGGYLGVSPRKVKVRYGEKGKPEVDSPGGISFNVSHSGDVALIGFARQRVIGVDIEKIRVDFDTDAIAKRFFSEQEQQELAALPKDERYRAFFTCWTLKESFIKALGEGLSHPLRNFDVSFTDPASVTLATRPDATEAKMWELHTLDVGPGYAAAFALQRQRNTQD